MVEEPFIFKCRLFCYKRQGSGFNFTESFRNISRLYRTKETKQVSEKTMSKIILLLGLTAVFWSRAQADCSASFGLKMAQIVIKDTNGVVLNKVHPNGGKYIVTGILTVDPSMVGVSSFRLVSKLKALGTWNVFGFTGSFNTDIPCQLEAPLSCDMTEKTCADIKNLLNLSTEICPLQTSSVSFEQEVDVPNFSSYVHSFMTSGNLELIGEFFDPNGNKVGCLKEDIALEV